MWEIRVVTVGKIKEPGALALAETYARRVGGEWRLVLDAAPPSRRPEPAIKRREETASLMARVPNGARAVALDPEGSSYDTTAFSSFLGELKDRGQAACFLVGGAHGLDKAILGGTARLSLSAMTMAHELATVVLCEQIYRAFALCTGRPYAK